MQTGVAASPKIFIWGNSSRGLEDGSPPVGSAANFRKEVSQKLKQFADIVYILTTETIRIWKFLTIFTSWFLSSVFHGGG